MEDPILQRAIASEQHKMKFQQLVHELTSTCWEKCIETPRNKLDSKQTNCITKCVDRFLDCANFVQNRTLTNASSSAVQAVGDEMEIM